MKNSILIQPFIDLGLNHTAAKTLVAEMNGLLDQCTTPEEAWQRIYTNIFPHGYSFDIQLLIFSMLFPNWHEHPHTAPAWIPTEKQLFSANISRLMTELNIQDLKSFHAWTVNHYEIFWQRMLEKLNIVFKRKPEKIVDLTYGVESPRWFPEARLNIADSCFTAADTTTALLYEDAHNNLITLSYAELNQLSNRIANSLVAQGFVAGDVIGISMPMNHYAVAIYLGIIKMGGVVASIADSFSAEEIATRLQIANAKAIFTQDFSLWSNKKIPLYEKMNSLLEAIKIFVVPCETKVTIPLRENDCAWENFLVENTDFTTIDCDPMSACNILFSSGTTGTPKAILWNHTTPIKAASDAYLYQNIQPEDVCAWPTNLGWMMGPWLIFATLINHACIALYSGAPKDRNFGEFVQRVKVTMLGIVPTIVASWRQSHCMENLDWSAIKVFSSSGECSNPSDMLYLMSLAGYKPIIEYCGGTEIGGAYLTSTVVENNYLSVFTTPTAGLDITIIDENGKPDSVGEVAIIAPSIGLSTQLLNADHHQIYFANMPTSSSGKILRRHGDQLLKLPDGHYCILGRVDDTMKLSGIKISAAEIERALVGLPHITETAAIAVPPLTNGPNLLIIYASTDHALNKEETMQEMQKRINLNLNPLFKIYDIVFTNELPKTASNKIMRRVLRTKYQSEHLTIS